MAVLNWKHHTLIQALMTRGPLKENEFHKIFAAVTGKNPRSHERDFNDFLLKINKELSYVQMELRRCRNQNDGQVCYGLVNNVSDEQSKFGTKYSVPQITFYKGVIEAIMQDATAQGSISTIDALNIRLENQVHRGMGSQSQGGLSQVPPALRNFSMSQKEKTLDELVHDQWLCHTPDGDIGLGVKSYLDLRSWFHNSGIPTCEVCNEAAIKAKVCQNEGCMLRIHHYCLKKKLSQSRGKIVCPTCGVQWEFQIPKPEAIEVEDELNEPTVSQPPAGSKRRKLKANRNADADIGACGSSQVSSATNLKRVTRSYTRMT
ncbi:hypothetical protein P3X46_010476 [Hevea brasiliensis]|uniref:Non-structural maintenance of chromosomes element 1 homolog n=1 Tax=Hevea brasiliensis TaxID=3981 RepID=A0ABQ9ME80_HEVBR|nr:uncharacterized protein LOC131180812 [Hevea brasiliensis]KAJ9178606.1 hypothetical protein P3X46_010476 [Hevea brasiliensis]